MRIKLWGVRGSLPSPISPENARWRLEEVLVQFERLKDAKSPISAREFLNTLPTHLIGGFGGNTSCAEVTVAKSRLIIDGGSGIRALSEHLLKTEPQLNEYHIYLTHFHWDHLIGLPFFVPIYIKGKAVHFYAVHDDLEENLRTLFRKPNFPVPFEAIESQIHFHSVTARQPFSVGGISITPYQLDHPDPCWGARIESGNKGLAWCVDTECQRISREELGEDVRLYTNADVMVFDAQYSFTEALEKINWGHSSGPIGIDIAIRENIKRAVFMHHDPAASDEMIRQAEDETRRYFDEISRSRKRAGLPTSPLDWHFAREGEVIEI